MGTESKNDLRYTDGQLGRMAHTFNADLREKLDTLHSCLKRDFKNVTSDTMIPYVIERAEKARLCSDEEAQRLRDEFLYPDGMPLFINPE